MPRLLCRAIQRAGVGKWRTPEAVHTLKDMGLRTRVAQAFSSLIGRRSGGLGLQDMFGSTGWFSSGGAPPRRGTPELLAAFKQSPVLRMVVERCASGVASTPWRLYTARDLVTGRAVRRRDIQALSGHRHRSAALYGLRLRGELTEVLTHPMLDMIYDPMPSAPSSVRLTGLEAMTVTQAGLDLVGSVGWILQRNATGMPIEAWPIPDSWITEVPTKERPVYRIKMGALDWQVPESEVVWFRVADPSNPYTRGTGLGATLGDEIETFEYASKHLKTWFYNRALPAGFVSVKGARQAELEAAKTRFENEYRGFWNAWRVHWHSGELDWHPVQQTFEQQQLAALRKDERDIVQHTFGIPPEILGILEQGSNRSTIDAADYLFTTKVIVPRLERIRAYLQFILAPQFDERLIVDYVSPVPEDQAFALRVVQAAPWAFRTNEIRTLANHPPDPDPKHDELPERPTITAGNAASGSSGAAGSDAKSEDDKADK